MCVLIGEPLFLLRAVEENRCEYERKLYIFMVGANAVDESRNSLFMTIIGALGSSSSQAPPWKPYVTYVCK